MLLVVAQDDVNSFRSENEWLEKHPKQAIVFNNSVEVWQQLRSTYNTNFKNLVYGELPD
jgi:hypothetical protein